jgi:hypothetical protein
LNDGAEICPACGRSDLSHVVDTRRTPNRNIRRRRQCGGCNHRWATIEVRAVADGTRGYDPVARRMLAAAHNL